MSLKGIFSDDTCLKGTLEVNENKMTYGDASKLYTLLDETNYQNYND